MRSFFFRIVSLILTLTFIFSAFSFNTSAAAQPEVVFGSATGCANEKIEIPVSVNNFSNVSAALFFVDLGGLEFVSVKSDKISLSKDVDYTFKNGIFKCVALSKDAVSSICGASAKIFTLTVKIPSTALVGKTYTISLLNTSEFCDSTLPEPNVLKATSKSSIVTTEEHHFVDATCTTPERCTLCTATIGSELGHKYTNVCDASCNVCSAKRTPPHAYKTTTTKATTKKGGSIVIKCTACSNVKSKTTIYYPKTIKLSTTSYTYNGKVKTPTVTVKNSQGKTISSSNYTVKYASGRKNVGKYAVTVTFKGNYSGTKTLYFTIFPPTTTVSKLTPGKKSIKVYVGKKTTQVTGYQIQYSAYKTFKSAKTKTLTSYKTTSATLKLASSKKTYYVRVRTYKTIGKTKYYSNWSTYKSAKTK